MVMNHIAVSPQDEYPHASPGNPQWREGYHFNAYDTGNRMALSISIGIRPATGIREEVVTLHKEIPLVYVSMSKLRENPLASGRFDMEPVELLKSWSIRLNGSFLSAPEGAPSRPLHKVKLGLHFESGEPVFGYSTERGTRYEQPGSLMGEIHLENENITFQGRGIRDHSWEARDMSSWEEWYSLMSCCPDCALVFNYLKSGGTVAWSGWLKRDDYSLLKTVNVAPTFSSGVLTQCRTSVGTEKEQMTLESTVLSHVSLSMGTTAGSAVEETVVQVNGGHGFLWYGRLDKAG
ncbi:MAG: hypothetical protein HXS40_06785 [Theionarchaea archaeon]|nr:hypothetical protein [Theionarchaea archaeon]